MPVDKSKKAMRDKIRLNFINASRPYLGAIMTTPLEAPRYVKPATLTDPPVPWWDFLPELQRNRHSGNRRSSKPQSNRANY